MGRTVVLDGLRAMAETLNNVKCVKHQTCQPEQLIIKFVDGSTMLVFRTGKFRIMGGKIDDLERHFNIYSSLPCMTSFLK